MSWYTTEDARRDALKQAERLARLKCADEIEAAIRSLQACPKSKANNGAISALQNQVSRFRHAEVPNAELCGERSESERAPG